MQFKINYFLNELNKTSEVIESLSGYIYNLVFGYYKILHTMIQSKYENLYDKERTNPKTKRTNITRTNVLEIVNLLHNEININIDLGEILIEYFNLTKIGNFIEKMKKISGKEIGKSFSKKFDFPFPIFPYLQFN